MVSGAYIQQKVNYGLGKAAGALGDPYEWYRPSGVNNPVSSGNLFGLVQATFSTDPGLTFARPSLYGKPDWYGAFDPTSFLVGDYLTGQLGTFFLVAIERFNPPHCIRCNRTIAIARMDVAITPGVSPIYSGDTTQNQTAVGAGWPCWLQMAGSGTSRVSTGMGLPSDSSLPVVQVFLPGTAPNIEFNDILTDDLGGKYYVRLAELSPLGWRISAEQVAQ